MVQFINYISLYIENSVKGNGFTFKGSKSSIFSLASLLSRGSTFKDKNLLLRSKFFPLKVDPILEELCSSHKQTGSRKSYFPLKTTVEKYRGVPIHSIIFLQQTPSHRIYSAIRRGFHLSRITTNNLISSM